MSEQVVTNYCIQDGKVILVDEQSRNIVDRQKAIFMAKELGLDLVQIAKNEYPVCKILDAGKYKYEQKKKHKRQKVVAQKEIRLRITTDAHDLEIKNKRIREFLEDRHEVKVTILLKGRESHFRNNAVEKLRSICDMTKDISQNGTVENTSNSVWVVLKPVKKD